MSEAPIWWRLPGMPGLRSRPWLNLRLVEALAWEEPGTTRIHMASGRAHLCPGTPGQIQASMDWTIAHPSEQVDPASVWLAPDPSEDDTMATGYVPLNIIELGHGSRLEQHHDGKIHLVTLTGSQEVEGATSAEGLKQGLQKLGVWQVPAGSSNWFAQGEGFGAGTVSTQTAPMNLAPVGPYQPDLKAAQADPARPRAGTGDQDMGSTAISPAEDKPAPEEEEPNAAPAPAAVRTTPEVQATSGGTAQPRKPGTKKG